MNFKTQIRMLVIFSLSLAHITCGDEATRGRRVVLQTQLMAPGDLAADFVTSTGWQVKLTQALVATGPFYYFSGAPVVARSAKRSSPWFEGLAGAFSIRSARAHPGHDSSGQALGQMLQPFSADLFAGPVKLPDGEGVTGLVRSAAFAFERPTAGPAASALAGQVAFAVGVAQKADRRVHFSAAARYEDLTNRSPNAAVAGCVVQAGDVHGPGTMNLTVDPRVWFQLVDFAEMPDGSADAPAVLPPGSGAHVGFLVGLLQLRAYVFTFSPDPKPNF